MERPPGPLVFDRVFLFAGEPEPDTEDPWSIDSARLIQINERSSVFRAELIRPNQQPEKVVLKIDPTGRREAEFITEAAAYETGAKELQGDLVPLFYGTFQTDIGNVVVTCTIIQYCGEPMEYALRDSDPDFLTQLVRVVDRLHRHGLSHGDLYERNILVKDGRPILIDLESLETHPCARRMNLLQGVLEPTVEEFGCPEMHDLILRCGAWRSGTCFVDL
ncbi:hypothetical protein C8J57DRAFT_1090135 [Mycena rebaudengoi]|nr:hypothetical protein C8J57DRAFT_1090135 [Mycena rebaudengoi]